MFELFRKRSALSLAVLILGLVFFVTYIASSLNQLQANVEELKNYEREAMEEFLNLSLEIDNNILNQLEQQWELLPLLPIENKLEIFTENIIPASLEYAILSIVVVYDDGQLNSVSFSDPGYDHFLKNIDLHEINVGEELIVINEQEEVKFGQGDRMFLSGRELKTQNQSTKIYLYVGFHEQIRVQDFISTTNLDLLDKNTDIIRQMLISAIIFMFSVIVYGIILLMLIRWFTTQTIRWFAKIKPFEEIAVHKGYMTEKQAQECLSDQNTAYRNDLWI